MYNSANQTPGPRNRITIGQRAWPLASAACLPLLLLLLSAVPAPLQAQFAFVTNNDTITITGYSGPGGNVIIPSETNGFPVTVISSNVFSQYPYNNVTSVTIPDSVISLGAGAFDGCRNLTNVVLGGGLSSIGDSAFFYCYRLNNVTIPATVTNIGSWAFYYCTSLAAVTLPNTITAIAIGTFAGCQNLTSLAIPESVTNIGDSAFSSCRSLTSVTIPNSVTSIGGGAFYGCTNLTDVMIPANVTSIGAAPFDNCTSLAVIAVDVLNSAYMSVDGVLFDKGRTLLIQCPGARTGGYAVPNTVTSIEDQAFEHCLGLTSVMIPSSVTNIGDYAFAWTPLQQVYFQGNAPAIGLQAFAEGHAKFLYYLPGTSGWSSPFVGCTAVLWNPQMLTSNGNFGVQTNRFGFDITGTPNIPLVVEASSDLAGASWNALLACTLTNGSIYFSDPYSTNYPTRYYRIRSP